MRAVETRMSGVGLRHILDSTITNWSITMNEDKIKGQWKQLQGKLKTRWGKLTDDDLRVAEGNAQYLAGKLQERYGIARDEATRQIREFDRDL